ncbi:PAS domain S-box protein [Geobacter sp. FeAm09]|uniref:ATP-binding protein n=1 Tax=Geobacter sp. FeAm09 TaxID=2597769 RepID=UPI0011ED75BB|nr:ATP-binding protein [Geobacter sp. FeAm09]QEM68622.1 PAS domain S-box protein [Geobacter sp. FeAm09]
MKQSLEKRIILFSFVILSMTTLANTGMDIAVFRRDYIQEMELRSQGLAAAFKANIEKVLALGINIRDVAGLADKCREIVQSDPEMAYCAIKGRDGAVLFVSDSSFAQLDFSRSGSGEGEKGALNSSTIEGPKGTYYDTQTPVRAFDGETAAFIHIGFPQQVIDQKVHAIVLRSIIVFFAFFIASFALVVYFLKRSIMEPISTLLEGVTRISRGDFTTPMQELPVYELNELSVKINSMAAALETRDTALRDNYKELSATHSQLHDSYLQLEKLSLELEKSEELYKKLLEESGDAIIILDQNETIIIANKMAEEFLGYPAADFVGKHVTALLLLLKLENIQHFLMDIADAFQGNHMSREVVIFNSRQEQLVGMIHASCVTMGDNSLLQVIIRDVTKARETITNLEKSAAGLARLNRMKDSFLGLASHELKTPLTVVMGYADLLQSDLKDQLPAAANEMVQNISNAAARLDTVIKDMIDVSKIDQKQLDLKLELVDVNGLVEETIRELRFFFALRKQEITVALDNSLPMIRGDRTRLLQLLSNILGNAIKFTPDGGNISVSTSLRYLLRDPQVAGFDGVFSSNAGKEQEAFLEIIVSDTGIGIDPDDQTRIFDKFYEVGNIEEHSSGKVAFKSRGAGLGLSIAKGVAEMHGGSIWVESQGQDQSTCPGTTFHILLPIESLSLADGPAAG